MIETQHRCLEAEKTGGIGGESSAMQSLIRLISRIFPPILNVDQGPPEV